MPVWPLLTVVLAASTPTPTAAAPKAPPAAPVAPAAPTAVAAEDFDLSRYVGRVVYLDFWASWCGPCVQSFPALAALQARYGDDGFVVVAINLDRDRKAADRFLEKHPVPFDVVYDPKGTLAEKWDIEVMPTSFLLDRDGKPRHDHQGFRPADGARIEAEVAAMLKDPPAAKGSR